MAKLYSFVQSVIQAGYGMSVRDVMETEMADLMGILAQTSQPKEEVLGLGDFIEAL